jgi:hypothetical protein
MTTSYAFPKLHNFEVNDIIACEGKEFMVTKVNSVNLKARNLKTGQPWNINKHLATFLRKSTPADHVQTVEVVKQSFVLGSIVDFQSKLYVVIALSSDGTYRIAKLGGDNNKYYRKVSSSKLKAVSTLDLPSRIIHG